MSASQSTVESSPDLVTAVDTVRIQIKDAVIEMKRKSCEKYFERALGHSFLLVLIKTLCCAKQELQHGESTLIWMLVCKDACHRFIDEGL